MGLGQALRDLDCGLEKDLDRKRAGSSDSSCECFPLDELHDDERGAGGDRLAAVACRQLAFGHLADLVDCADTGMIEGGGHAGLTEKARMLVVADCRGCGDQLQRDGASQGRVLRPIHHTHPTFADLFENSVVAERLPDHRNA